MIADIITDIVRDQSVHDEVAVLLSAGVDSLSVAFAANRLGKKITGYSFIVDGKETTDSKGARQAAREFGWNHVTIDVPVNNLKNDFFRLIKDYDCKKKTQLECTFPFLYVYPKIKEQDILTGWAADGYYGLSRRAIQHHRKSKQSLNEFRSKYFGAENVVGFNQQKQLAEEHSKNLIAPYFDKRVSDFFYQFDWYEVNKPSQKHHVKSSFHEFSRIMVRKHENLQKVSKIDVHYEFILDDQCININGRRRVLDVVGDWHRLIHKEGRKIPTF